MRGRDLLSKYIESGLSNDERFELEKLALDDDFLADAWEGLSSPESNNTKKILARLNERLALSNPETKVIPLYKKMWPYAVAASVIFVMSVGILLRSEQNVTTDSIASKAKSIRLEETMADVSSVTEDLAEVVSSQSSESLVLSSEEKEKINQNTIERSSSTQFQQSEPSGSVASIDLNKKLEVRTDESTAQTIARERSMPSSQTSNDDSAASQNKVLANAKLDVNSSSVSNNQPAEEKIINHKPEQLPKARARKKIDQLEITTTASKDNKINSPALKKEADIDQMEGVVIVQSDSVLDIEAFIAIQEKDEEVIIASTDGDNIEILSEIVDSGLPADLIAANRLRGATLSSALDANVDCITAQSQYRDDYYEDPLPTGARDLYKLLQSSGCPTDGSDAFMIDLKSSYEAWAREMNAKKQLEFESNNPAMLASKAYKGGQFDRAINKYHEAIAQETNDAKKAQHHFSIASILFRKLNRYNSAKEEALIAASLNPKFGRPYMLIGDMYAATAHSCGDDWNQRLAILAATDKYQKAKSVNTLLTDEVSGKIQRYRASYPAKDEAFMKGIKSGDTQRVDCWINESVTVRFR